MKRISSDSKGRIVLTQMAVLSDSQALRLESSYLRKEIEALAKRLKFRWYIENNGQHLMLCCSRTFDDVDVEDSDMHDLEMKQDTFLSEIGKMDLKKQDEVEEPKNEDEQPAVNDIAEFMQELINNNDIKCAKLTVLEARIPLGCITGSCGSISKSLLDEMCQAWLDTHKQA